MRKPYFAQKLEYILFRHFSCRHLNCPLENLPFCRLRLDYEMPSAVNVPKKWCRYMFRLYDAYAICPCKTDS